MDVLDESGAALSPEVIQSSLIKIVRENDEKDPPVGVLTTLPRDEWASVRERLLKDNSETLRSIDESLFAVCLSDQSPQGDIEKEARCMLHGEARDRWFDKSFQLVVSRDGEAAINFEHAWGDGIAVVRICVNDSSQKPHVI